MQTTNKCKSCKRSKGVSDEEKRRHRGLCTSYHTCDTCGQRVQDLDNHRNTCGINSEPIYVLNRLIYLCDVNGDIKKDVIGDVKYTKKIIKNFLSVKKRLKIYYVDGDVKGDKANADSIYKKIYKMLKSWIRRGKRWSLNLEAGKENIHLLSNIIDDIDEDHLIDHKIGQSGDIWYTSSAKIISRVINELDDTEKEEESSLTIQDIFDQSYKTDDGMKVSVVRSISLLLRQDSSYTNRIFCRLLKKKAKYMLDMNSVKGLDESLDAKYQKDNDNSEVTSGIHKVLKYVSGIRDIFPGLDYTTVYNPDGSNNNKVYPGVWVAPLSTLGTILCLLPGKEADKLRIEMLKRDSERPQEVKCDDFKVDVDRPFEVIDQSSSSSVLQQSNSSPLIRSEHNGNQVRKTLGGSLNSIQDIFNQSYKTADDSKASVPRSIELMKGCEIKACRILFVRILKNKAKEILHFKSLSQVSQWLEGQQIVAPSNLKNESSSRGQRFVAPPIDYANTSEKLTESEKLLKYVPGLSEEFPGLEKTTVFNGDDEYKGVWAAPVPTLRNILCSLSGPEAARLRREANETVARRDAGDNDLAQVVAENKKYLPEEVKKFHMGGMKSTTTDEELKETIKETMSVDVEEKSLIKQWDDHIQELPPITSLTKREEDLYRKRLDTDLQGEDLYREIEKHHSDISVYLGDLYHIPCVYIAVIRLSEEAYNKSYPKLTPLKPGQILSKKEADDRAKRQEIINRWDEDKEYGRTFYKLGYTKNIRERFITHMRDPDFKWFNMIAVEPFPTLDDAMKVEDWLKLQVRREKLDRKIGKKDECFASIDREIMPIISTLRKLRYEIDKKSPKVLNSDVLERLMTSLSDTLREIVNGTVQTGTEVVKYEERSATSLGIEQEKTKREKEKTQQVTEQAKIEKEKTQQVTERVKIEKEKTRQAEISLDMKRLEIEHIKLQIQAKQPSLKDD